MLLKCVIQAQVCAKFEHCSSNGAEVDMAYCIALSRLLTGVNFRRESRLSKQLHVFGGEVVTAILAFLCLRMHRIVLLLYILSSLLLVLCN